MKRHWLIFSGLIILGAGAAFGVRTLLPVEAKDSSTSENQIVTPTTPDAQKAPAAGTAEAGIRRITEEYVKAFNAHDPKAAATLWTSEGEYTGVDGQVVRGQAAIEKLLAGEFKAHPKVQIEVQVESVRPLSRQTAMAEAAVKLKYPGGTGIEETRYSALHVLEDGQWRVASVREWFSEPAINAEMKQLDFLVGSWTAKGKAGTIAITYSWDESRAFLQGKYTICSDGKTVSSGTQIFRLNPRGGVKSWTFDSNGTCCTGVWTWEDTRWIDESTGTMPDGTEVISVNILTPRGPDSFIWMTTERSSNGVSIASPPPLKVTRVKPAN